MRICVRIWCRLSVHSPKTGASSVQGGNNHARGMPVRSSVTEGARVDCKETVHLIEGISAETLLAGRGYDTNAILTYVVSVASGTVL